MQFILGRYEPPGEADIVTLEVLVYKKKSQ